MIRSEQAGSWSELRIESTDSDVAVRVRGDIDDENIAHFESLLSAAAAPATARLTVDLTECEYINCRVITALILAARAHPGDFAVKVRASGSVFKIFEVTGLLNHGGSVRVERG